MHPKAQYYIPQFYLRYFASKHKKQFKIFCFDKSTGKSFETGIKNIAHETGFYDFVDESGTERSIEEFLGALESESKGAFEAVVSKPTSSTVHENKAALAKFFAYQMVRTRVFRTEYSDSLRGANEQLRNKGVGFPIPTENETKQFQADFLLQWTPSFSDVLLSMKWVLLLNYTGKPFWISDHPIVRYNPHPEKLAGNLGLKSPGIQVLIPISDRIALTLCDPQEYTDAQQEIKATIYNVTFINSCQVLYSRQYLFSGKDDFELARQMIRESPELGDPERKRVIVN